MNRFWLLVHEIYSTRETVTKTLTEPELTNELTNIRTDEQKDENYIPISINAGIYLYSYTNV